MGLWSWVITRRADQNEGRFSLEAWVIGHGSSRTMEWRMCFSWVSCTQKPKSAILTPPDELISTLSDCLPQPQVETQGRSRIESRIECRIQGVVPRGRVPRTQPKWGHPGRAAVPPAAQHPRPHKAAGWVGEWLWWRRRLRWWWWGTGCGERSLGRGARGGGGGGGGGHLDVAVNAAQGVEKIDRLEALLHQRRHLRLGELHPLLLTHLPDRTATSRLAHLS